MQAYGGLPPEARTAQALLEMLSTYNESYVSPRQMLRVQVYGGLPPEARTAQALLEMLSTYNESYVSPRQMLRVQVYGGLPPEARTAQALLFNTPRTGRNVLVASDAIGMGLNLGIRCSSSVLDSTTTTTTTTMVYCGPNVQPCAQRQAPGGAVAGNGVLWLAQLGSVAAVAQGPLRPCTTAMGSPCGTQPSVIGRCQSCRVWGFMAVQTADGRRRRLRLGLAQISKQPPPVQHQR